MMNRASHENDKELATKISGARDALGWSQAELARRANCHHSMIQRYEQGKFGKNPRALPKVLEALGLAEPEDIEIGSDERALIEAWRRVPAQHRRHLRGLIDGLAGARQPAQRPAAPLTLVPDTNLLAQKMVTLRLVGSIAAGSDGWVIPEGERLADEVDVPEEHVSGRMVAVMVRGDSMAPTVKPGGLVLIRRRKPHNGDMAVVEAKLEDNGDVQGWVKRVRKDGDGWLLESDNPDFPPFRVEARNVKRIAKVEGIWHPENELRRS